MLITMDLRHLYDQNVNWVYGEDWDISISISSNRDTDNFTLTLDSVAKPVLLSEQFLTKSTSKSQLLEFELMAWDTLFVRIDVLIYNALYINHKYAFMNSTSVEIRVPNRAVMNTEKVFILSV
jgi:hypothetical protein